MLAGIPIDGELVRGIGRACRRPRCHVDAAMVLNAAAPTVLEALASKAKTPLLEWLPDAQVLAGGGLEVV